MINGIKEFLIHNNFGPEDIHFHFSGIGWTLFNISIGVASLSLIGEKTC